ncbi:MAG TPA: hypothetical protein VMU32_11685 [Solirubrobacteraceae bacterium]|nr:hypothetical protein [Solirubrobacteraceae bacterium]
MRRRRKASATRPLLLGLACCLPVLTWGAASPALAATATEPTAPGSPAAATGAAQRPAEVTLPPRSEGPRWGVTMAPVGLSLEYPLMAQDLGAGPCPPPALVAELQRLGSPPLALSGISQDLTAPPGVLPNPAPSWEVATLYPLPPPFWSQLHCLLAATKDPLDVGLNMHTGSPTWAAAMVAGARTAATNGLEFSLGNEPDLYFYPNYASLAKGLPGHETKAANLYLQLAGALEPTLGGAPVIGPELAISALWRRQLPRVIAAVHDRTVGVHLYPLSACEGPGAVTIPKLLAPAAANAPQSLQWVVADAAAAGAPAILSEANSASCGGQEGVSNTPAAAVWAVRYVLAALKTGFREVRFHFSNGAYDPFVMRGGQVYPRPLESALVALNRWLPLGATLTTVPGVRGLVATAIAVPATPATATAPAKPATWELILDNETAKPRTVMLRGAQGLSVESLSAVRAGMQVGQAGASGGRLKLVVAGNSVATVLPAG